MKNTDPKHKHTYDAQGKMTCCSQEEKINKMADKQVKKCAGILKWMMVQSQIQLVFGKTV